MMIYGGGRPHRWGDWSSLGPSIANWSFVSFLRHPPRHPGGLPVAARLAGGLTCPCKTGHVETVPFRQRPMRHRRPRPTSANPTLFNALTKAGIAPRTTLLHHRAQRRHRRCRTRASTRPVRDRQVRRSSPAIVEVRRHRRPGRRRPRVKAWATSSRQHPRDRRHRHVVRCFRGS